MRIIKSEKVNWIDITPPTEKDVEYLSEISNFDNFNVLSLYYKIVERASVINKVKLQINFIKIVEKLIYNSPSLKLL